MSDYKEGKFYANNIDNNVNDTHQAYGTTIRYIQSVRAVTDINGSI